jgi:hypothetical protein
MFSLRASVAQTSVYYESEHRVQTVICYGLAIEAHPLESLTSFLD